jgi:hypothetical protein
MEMMGRINSAEFILLTENKHRRGGRGIAFGGRTPVPRSFATASAVANGRNSRSESKIKNLQGARSPHGGIRLPLEWANAPSNPCVHNPLRVHKG